MAQEGKETRGHLSVPAKEHLRDQWAICSSIPSSSPCFYHPILILQPQPVWERLSCLCTAWNGCPRRCFLNNCVVLLAGFLLNRHSYLNDAVRFTLCLLFSSRKFVSWGLDMLPSAIQTFLSADMTRKTYFWWVVSPKNKHCLFEVNKERDREL